MRTEEQRAKHREEQRRYMERHPEKHKASVAKYRRANKGKIDAINAAWRVANRTVVLAHRKVINANYRGHGGRITYKDLRTMLKAQGGRCWWCKEVLGSDYQLDHRIPRSRGGTSEPSNIVVSCPSCNLRKSRKLPSEWAGRLL